jgi:hypothetical protein
MKTCRLQDSWFRELRMVLCWYCRLQLCLEWNTSVYFSLVLILEGKSLHYYICLSKSVSEYVPMIENTPKCSNNFTYMIFSTWKIVFRWWPKMQFIYSNMILLMKFLQSFNLPLQSNGPLLPNHPIYIFSYTRTYRCSQASSTHSIAHKVIAMSLHNDIAFFKENVRILKR